MALQNPTLHLLRSTLIFRAELRHRDLSANA